jgi:hypothetical protein
MKKYIIYIVIFVIGVVISTQEKKLSESNNYILLFPIILIFLMPFLKLLFPKLKDLQIGTSNFFPNLISFFQNKK